VPSIGPNATSLGTTTQWNTDHLNKHYVAPHMCVCSSGRIWQQTEMRVGIYFVVTWPRCYEPVRPVGFCRDTCSLHHAPLSSCGRQIRLTQNTRRVSLCARYLTLHGDYIEEAIGRTRRMHGQLKGAYRITVKHWTLAARRRRWEDIVMYVREIKLNAIVLDF